MSFMYTAYSPVCSKNNPYSYNVFLLLTIHTVPHSLLKYENV